MSMSTWLVLAVAMVGLAGPGWEWFDPRGDAPEGDGNGH